MEIFPEMFPLATLYGAVGRFQPSHCGCKNPIPTPLLCCNISQFSMKAGFLRSMLLRIRSVFSALFDKESNQMDVKYCIFKENADLQGLAAMIAFPCFFSTFVFYRSFFTLDLLSLRRGDPSPVPSPDRDHNAALQQNPVNDPALV